MLIHLLYKFTPLSVQFHGAYSTHEEAEAALAVQIQEFVDAQNQQRASEFAAGFSTNELMTYEKVQDLFHIEMIEVGA